MNNFFRLLQASIATFYLIVSPPTLACESLTLNELVEAVFTGEDAGLGSDCPSLDDPVNTIPEVPSAVLKHTLAYLQGEAVHDAEAIITKDNYREYLNAVKYFDLLNPEGLKRSSYGMRMAALLNSGGSVKTMEAFSYRLNPSFFSEVDANGNFDPSKKLEIYHAGEYTLQYVPGWQEVQTSIIREVVTKVFDLSMKMKEEAPTLILFTGTYGSGKSYQTKNHHWMVGLNVGGDVGFTGVLSSDAVKRLYRARIEGAINAQVHHEGVALKNQIMKGLYTFFPELNMVQEGAISGSKSSVNRFFDQAVEAGKCVKVVDLDTDLLISCLRILTRNTSSGEPSPPFRATVGEQERTRESRRHLLDRVQDDPMIVGYELRYFKDGESVVVARKIDGVFEVVQGKERLFLKALTPTDAEDVEAVASRFVTIEDVELFGERLTPFVGLTIEEAMLSLSQM